MIWKMLRIAKDTKQRPLGVSLCIHLAFMFLIPFFFFFTVWPLICRGLPCAQIPFLASASWARCIWRLKWDPREGSHPYSVLPTNVLQRQSPAELMDLRRRNPASHCYNRQVSVLTERYPNAVFRQYKTGEEIYPVLQTYTIKWIEPLQKY